MENNIQLELLRGQEASGPYFVAQGRKIYYVLKRVMDIFAASILLLLALPLMALVAVAIYISSPGPVIFSQERVGAKRCTNGKFFYWKRVIFKCYKFRTMKLNADTAIHQAYVKALIENNEEQMDALQGQPTNSRKLVNDHRLIRSGKFLRKFSLDELPQFWNVLLGDMSLVGPRPAIPYEVEIYKPWHLKRLEAQPGITGLQQIKARSVDFEQQVKLDIEYIEKQSTWLDIKIILQTPIAVFKSKGAY